MTGKQITELESTDVFGVGDLMLTRKTTSGTDRKINYTDLVKSIGNPAIEGFVASSTQANTITLSPVNSAKIPSYLIGMKISFVSPITTTANVQVKIGTLGLVDFVQYQTTSTVILQANDYVEAVFIGTKFHRINDLRSVANIYSNEYTVILTTIDPSEQFTNLTLVSSIGIPKQSYYDGMAISFITPENTKGVTQVSIDGIPGLKTIFEPDPEDFISSPLYTNQIVRAIYKTAQGGFIKDNFKVNDPTIEIVSITQDPTNEQIENNIIPDVVVPVQNLLEYSVDTNSTGLYSFSTLKECIEKILSNFPSGAESGIKVTITINKILDASSTLFTVDRDLGWITLRSINQSIVINKGGTQGYIFTQTGGTFFNFEENTTILVNNALITEHASFIQASNGIINFKNITFNISNVGYAFSLSSGSNLTLTNCNLLNMRIGIYCVMSNMNLFNCTIKGWSQMAIFPLSTGVSITVTLNGCDLRAINSSSLNDITTVASTWIGSKTLINQTNTKAKCGQGGVLIQANTTFGDITYNVSGGQD